MRRWGVGVAFVACVLFSCSDELAGEGEPCVTSVACGPGLLCDTTLEQPVCVRMGSPHPDLSAEPEVPMDLAGVDLTGADLSANPTADMAQPAAMDLASAD